MAEVKLYIYKGSEKGDAVSLGKGGIYSFDKSTILPPKKDTDTETGVVTLSSKTITNTYHVALPSLTKLTYLKKVYEPCEIHAEIQVGSVQMKTTKVTKIITFDKQGKELSSSETKEEGKFTEVENDPAKKLKGATYSGKDLSTSFTGAKVILEIDGNTVAENYMVFKVRTIHKTISNSTSQFLELTIYSADKMMDLDKYSRAYTAKKLYTDILAEESKKFNLKDADKEEDCTSLSTLIVNHMQMLKYKESEKKKGNDGEKVYEWSERDELRIPYIVQYNETFYQFLSRAANRFGEFLFFEDGKLNLGMQPSDANYYKKDSEGKIKQDESGADTIIDWATELNALQSRYYESMLSKSINVEDRAYNYINHTENDNVGQLYADSSLIRYNPDPVATNQWTTQELIKGEYLDYNEILGEEMKASVAGVIFKALKASTFSEVMVNMVKGFIMKLIEVSQSTNDFNRVMDRTHFQDKNKHYLISDDQRSDDYYSQFSTYQGSENLSNNFSTLFQKSNITNFIDLFYSVIRHKEKEISEHTVWLDFGNHYKPIKLGDKLRVDGTDYVAIYVEGSYFYENKKLEEHLLVSAIPVMNLESSTGGITPDGEEAWTSVIPIPPALTNVTIREAKPQVAFVADSLDPELMGRIRVRYPWQTSDGDATPWIRVTLPMATKGGAVNFTPSVGDEVMVGYVHGNIDHPYAMGYLASPFVNKKWSNALPLDQYGCAHGIKTKTGHHLTFEDGYALAPMLFNTIGCLSVFKSLWPTGQIGPWPWGFETTADLGGGFELSDRYGFYKISGSTDERSVTIESPAGTVEVNAFQGITISAPNGEVNITGKNVNISANNRLTLTSGDNIKDKLTYQKKWNEDKAKGVGYFALMEGKGALGALGEVATNFTDLSFVRCFVEWLVRHVNGTLQIKSYTFVTIEAGEGKVGVPPKSLRKLELPTLYNEYLTANLIKHNVYALIENIHQKYDTLVAATEAFNRISGTEGVNKNESAISYDKVVKADELLDNNFTWEDGNGNGLNNEDLIFNNPAPKPNEYRSVMAFNIATRAWRQMETDFLKEVEKRNHQREIRRTEIVTTSTNLMDAAKELSDAAKKWTDMKDSDFNYFHYNKDKIDASEAVKKIKEESLYDFFPISLNEMKNRTYKKTIAKINEGTFYRQAKYLTRYIIYQYLSDQGDIDYDKTAIKNKDDVLENDKWRKFVSSLKKNEGIGATIKEGLKDWAKEELNPFAGFVDDHFQWKLGFQGQILMSDQYDKTASFDPDQNLVSHDNQVEDSVDLIIDMLKKL